MSELWMESPVGPIRLEAREGALVAVHLSDTAAPVEATAVAPGDGALLERARAQLGAWFAGERTAFDLPLRPDGTSFQQAVWAALREIPFGETRTYGELARALGRPSASRAVGAANGQNPLAIVVPCHRVVGAGGALTGYAGGLHRKRWLLAHEREVVARTAGFRLA